MTYDNKVVQSVVVCFAVVDPDGPESKAVATRTLGDKDGWLEATRQR